MAYTSTRALQNSLPNRSPSHRPRSLSLSEYQPLTFDREATAAAYRRQLQQPTSAATSSSSHWPLGDTSASGSGSAQSHETNQTARTSTISLSQYLRPGDNPHIHSQPDARNQVSSPIDGASSLGAPAPNFAGWGAGHSLTPPQSPIHQAAQRAHRDSLTLANGDVPDFERLNIGDDPAAGPPAIPRRPSVIPPSTYQPDYEVSDAAPTTPLRRQGGQRQRSDSATSGIHRSPPPSWLVSHDAAAAADNAPGTTSLGLGLGLSERERHRDAARPDSMAATAGSGRYADETASSTGHGYESDPGYPRYVGGRGGGRRALPTVPTNVPAPEPPGWEPDYKSHIPPGLTQSSVEHAYAQLSAPPPGLPPRRNDRPQARYGQGSLSVVPQMSLGEGSGSYNNVEPQNSAYATQQSRPGPSGTTAPYQQPHTPVGNVPSGGGPMSRIRDPYAIPPAGAPSFPPDPNINVTPIRQLKPRRPAEESVTLKAEGRTPIWSTHFLDPCLRNPLIHIPQNVANMTSKAMSASTQAQVDGIAKVAKEWFVPPDARFLADRGAIELGLGVIDSGEEGWGREKGRRRARIEVISRNGAIKLDLIEIEDNRQVDLKVDTKLGDILILLPQDFCGVLNVTTPGPAPHFCRSMPPTMSAISHPYETFYSTFLAPPSKIPTHLLQPGSDPEATAAAGAARPHQHTAARKRQQWVPEFLRSSEDYMGLMALTGGEWSKINVNHASGKGRIVLGYRETEDEAEIKGLGLKVGMHGQERRKKWWK